MAKKTAKKDLNISPERQREIGAEIDRSVECYFAKRFNDDRLGDKIDEWLEAQKTVSAVSGKDAGAGTVDFVDVPDYATQIRAGQMIVTLRGLDKKKVDLKHSMDQSLMAMAVKVLRGTSSK